jgi:curved DNA-binding protein CbpA
VAGLTNYLDIQMESLYGVLGVEPNADEQAIVRAYRKLAKRYHPDVADTPEASERFKRLTTAKEVLTDTDERARYDRLGPDRYARQYLGDSWAADGDTVATVDGAPGRGESVSEAAGRAASETASTTAEPRSGQRVNRNDGYATASEYYQPGQRLGVESRGGLTRMLGSLREVLPWLLAHLALLAGAIAVAAVLLSSTGGVPPVATVIVAATMVGATAGVSALHLSAALFR